MQRRNRKENMLRMSHFYSFSCIFNELFSVTCSTSPIIRVKDCLSNMLPPLPPALSSLSPTLVFPKKPPSWLPSSSPSSSSSPPQTAASVGGGVELRRLPETPAGAGRLLKQTTTGQREGGAGEERTAQRREANMWQDVVSLSLQNILWAWPKHAASTSVLELR